MKILEISFFKIPEIFSITKWEIFTGGCWPSSGEATKEIVSNKTTLELRSGMWDSFLIMKFSCLHKFSCHGQNKSKSAKAESKWWLEYPDERGKKHCSLLLFFFVTTFYWHQWSSFILCWARWWLESSCDSYKSCLNYNTSISLHQDSFS